MKNILICGNLLRFRSHLPYQSNQNGNIRWIYNMLSPILKCLGYSSEMVLWDKDTTFDSKTFYGLQGHEFKIEKFPQIINEEPTNKVLEYMGEIFTSNLVIGIEMPIIFKRIFDTLGIVYIDFMFSPVRFSYDLMLACESNSEKMQNRIFQSRVPNDAIEMVAGLRKARLQRLPEPPIKEGSIIFAGQTGDDVSVICGGKFINLTNVKEKFSEIVNKRPVYFKPHPFADRAVVNKQYSQLKSIVGRKVEMTQSNIYRLFCTDHVYCVSALTSSVIVESEYFSANGVMLAEYPFKLSGYNEEEGKGFVNIGNKLLTKEFWNNILHDVDEDFSMASCFTAPLLRSSLGESWGADIFTSNITSQKKGLGVFSRVISAVNK